jgi:hypothetical protein
MLQNAASVTTRMPDGRPVMTKINAFLEKYCGECLGFSGSFFHNAEKFLRL